jgi:dolichyl-phosphate-mannose-protein mannosyltransferase
MIKSRDMLLGALIFLVAFLLRVPFFWYPASTVFDEGIYATYISNIVYDRPYFELHPPLPNIIMASVARTQVFTYMIRRGTDVSFGDFPYLRLRLINVILGSLLAVLVFVAARFLGSGRFLGVMAGLGIAFDNALIVYSRTFLPDTMLITFGAAGIVLYLWHVKKEKSVPIVLASILFGLACSVKWIGFAFTGVAVVASLVHKKYKEVAILCGGVGATYIAVFFIFFAQFSGGFLTDRFSFDAVPALAYPEPWSMRETLSFLPQYTKLMYEANFTVANHPHASKPWQWPLGQGTIGMWDEGDRHILLAPNIFGWGAVFLAVIFSAISGFYRRLSRPALFALVGYCISFIPFFVIGRPFFMYHYFMALVFGWMLASCVAGEIRDMVASRMSDKVLCSLIVVCLVIGFCIGAPFTYGI